jgi:hypothetical protein
MAVGHPDGGDAEERRGGEQLLGMGGAAQEGEVGGDLQLGVAFSPAAHPKMPWMNQRCEPVPGSRPSPER